MKTTIIINEQHSLLPSQAALLPDDYETLKVPAEGWNRRDMDEIMEKLEGTVIFVSPIPYMISSLSFSAGQNATSVACCTEYPYAPMGKYMVAEVLCFCNDTREKKELPNGKVISVTAQTGWYLA